MIGSGNHSCNNLHGGSSAHTGFAITVFKSAGILSAALPDCFTVVGADEIMIPTRCPYSSG